MAFGKRNVGFQWTQWLRKWLEWLRNVALTGFSRCGHVFLESVMSFSDGVMGATVCFVRRLVPVTSITQSRTP